MCLVLAPFPAPTRALLAALKITSATISPASSGAADVFDDGVSSFKRVGVPMSNSFEDVVESISEEINELTTSLLSRKITSKISNSKINKTTDSTDVMAMADDANSIATASMLSTFRTSALLTSACTATLEAMDMRTASDSSSCSELNTIFQDEGNLREVSLSESSFISVHDATDGKATTASHAVINAVAKVGAFVITAAMALLKFCGSFFSCYSAASQANGGTKNPVNPTGDAFDDEGDDYGDGKFESEPELDSENLAVGDTLAPNATASPPAEGFAFSDRLDALLAEAVACQLGFIEQLKQLECGEWNPDDA